MKKFLIIFCLSIIALFGGLILSKWIANIVADHLDTKVQSEHFKISYNFSDEKAIPDIQKYLEDNYERVTTDLKQQLYEPVAVKIYPDLESFHRAVRVHGNFFWWTGDVGDRVVGTANGGVMRIVSPLNPGNSGFTYDEILKVVVHEFTHVVATQINSKNERSFVLSEGIAVYEAGQDVLPKEMSLNDIVAYLPTSIEEMFSWGHDNEPQKMYGFGGMFVGFIIDNYGYDKFIELYRRDYSDNVFDDEIRDIYTSWISKMKNI